MTETVDGAHDVQLRQPGLESAQLQLDPPQIALQREFRRVLMVYKFGIDEMMTKINILREEFGFTHDHNPIEHVKSRLKTPESVVEKAVRKNLPLTLDAIRENIYDIAGIRITCSFVSDVYRIFDLITGQHDIRVVQVKDYIARPKPNGYRSLHAIVEVPVFMSDRVQPVFVELQIRTVAMDFWASLEHKIFYKYDKAVPAGLLDELRAAAATARDLDVRMEALHDQVHGSRQSF
ncbi:MULTISPECIES: GTP pyrophosphokinase [Rhodococcus]|uniref:GTP pyrophosphokinase n=1 Tax=Rhodococcus TaxID=1827 RepID=UPI001DD056A1|nr:putative GTP pyrophosphokinase [Rhodococcus ruber]